MKYKSLQDKFGNVQVISCTLLSKWAAEHEVKKMENITRALVIQYGHDLQKDIESGKRKGSSSAKNYVSAVNTVMTLATNYIWQTVRPGKDCGIEKRRYIAVEGKAISTLEHEKAKIIVNERIGCLLDLQRTLGLRFKESALLNAKTALKQVNKYGYIKLDSGTKGGRKRTVPCRPCGIKALEKAASIQDEYSMIPKSMTYKEFQDECYRQAEIAGINFHAERHYYAQERYREIAQSPCPVEASWSRKERIDKLAEHLGIDKDNAQEIDELARLQISKELGHNRVEITNAYLG